MPEIETLYKNTALGKLSPLYRMLASLCVAVLFYFIMPAESGNSFIHLLASLNVFSIAVLVLSWITIFSTKPAQMHDEAVIQHETRTIVFVILLISILASMLAVIILLTGEHGNKITRELNLLTAVGGMLLSWFLMHTIFTFRYAHMYYRNIASGANAGGIIFPGETNPDYLDFAYFSFVLGMTFQVSDVNVTARAFRRLALFHGILSFGYNTIIVALTINIIAGLNK